MQENLFSSDDAFAYILPLSRDTERAFKIRQNRTLLDDMTVLRFLHKEGIAAPVQRRRLCAIRLDFENLMGRRSISIGVSRSNDIILPRAAGVDGIDILFHLDTRTAALLATKKASSWAWYRDGERNIDMIRHQPITVRPGNGICIEFGDHGRFKLAVYPVTVLDNPQHWWNRFSNWMSSIQPLLEFGNWAAASSAPRNNPNDASVKGRVAIQSLWRVS